MSGYGWMGGGFGLFWVQVVLVITVVVVMAWVLKQMGKEAAPGQGRSLPGKHE